MKIKGQNSKENLVAKESYYIDKNILSAFNDIKKESIKKATEDNKMDKAVIEVDFAWDQDEESLENALKDSFDGYDLEYKVITENGPAGGWPVIKAEGDRRTLEKWLNEQYGIYPGEEWVYFKDIKKEPAKKDERESEVPDATEACACEDTSGDEMANLYLSLDEANTDEEISDVAEMAENSLANGDITMEDYNTFISELNNKK